MEWLNKIDEVLDRSRHRDEGGENNNSDRNNIHHMSEQQEEEPSSLLALAAGMNGSGSPGLLAGSYFRQQQRQRQQHHGRGSSLPPQQKIPRLVLNASQEATRNPITQAQIRDGSSSPAIATQSTNVRLPGRLKKKTLRRRPQHQELQQQAAAETSGDNFNVKNGDNIGKAQNRGTASVSPGRRRTDASPPRPGRIIASRPQRDSRVNNGSSSQWQRPSSISSASSSSTQESEQSMSPPSSLQQQRRSQQHPSMMPTKPPYPGRLLLKNNAPPHRRKKSPQLHGMNDDADASHQLHDEEIPSPNQEERRQRREEPNDDPPVRPEILTPQADDRNSETDPSSAATINGVGDVLTQPLSNAEKTATATAEQKLTTAPDTKVSEPPSCDAAFSDSVLTASLRSSTKFKEVGVVGENPRTGGQAQQTLLSTNGSAAEMIRERRQTKNNDHDANVVDEIFIKIPTERRANDRSGRGCSVTEEESRSMEHDGTRDLPGKDDSVDDGATRMMVAGEQKLPEDPAAPSHNIPGRPEPVESSSPSSGTNDVRRCTNLSSELEQVDSSFASSHCPSQRQISQSGEIERALYSTSNNEAVWDSSFSPHNIPTSSNPATTAEPSSPPLTGFSTTSSERDNLCIRQSSSDGGDDFEDVQLFDDDDLGLLANGDAGDPPPATLPRSVQVDAALGNNNQPQASWKEEPGAPPWKSDMNCDGVVHVRVLSAGNLNCSLGSKVHAVVSLLPWKGQVRTEAVKSYRGDGSRRQGGQEQGVCALWGDNVPLVSMVHAYSGDESPVPSIKIELRFSPLGLIDITLCSLTLPCEDLMKSPLARKRQVFAATEQDLSGAPRSSPKNARSRTLVEVEAMFEPARSSAQRTPLTPVRASKSETKESSPATSESSTATRSKARNTLSPTRTPRVGVSSERSSVRSSIRKRGSNLSTATTTSRHHHLLRLSTHYTPATCCVCKRSIMSGLLWKIRAFHCEECNVDCCADCQVQVDVQLPCGSDAASKAVKGAIQNKLTLDNILGVVAPVQEPFLQTEKGAVASSADKISAYAQKDSTSSMGSHRDLDDGRTRGIGCMKMDFIRAHVLENTLPAETDLGELVDDRGKRFRDGDYYVRVSWSGSQKTTRTRTIQCTGRPRFESGEMRFNVPHYGTEFRVEVVDASREKPIGATLITAQAMLQQQRDLLVKEHGIPLFSFVRGPVKFGGKLRLVLELRTGLSNAEFFSPPKKSSSSADSSKSRPGDIVGWIELLAGLEEDMESLYGKVPYECPARPAPSLDMKLFQAHVSRISSFVGDIKRTFDMYQYVVSWKNPALTSLAMLLFILFCYRFDPAYIGSIPFFFLMMFMLFRASLRGHGTLKTKLTKKEIDAHRKVKESVNYTLHRPVGRLAVRVTRGKNLRTPEMGLPGKAGCRVYWDPVRYLAEEEKRKAAERLDMAQASTHDIGSTLNDMYAINPTWEKMVASDGTKRLQQLLPNHGDFFEVSDDRNEGDVEFPVLQPFKLVGDDMHSLEPWASSPAGVVVRVRFRDPLNILPGSEYALGEVSIPFSILAQRGEVSGWFHVLDVGTRRVLPGQGDSGAASDQKQSHGLDDESPEVYLRMRWTPPRRSEDASKETEHEASIVIQEEMIRSAVLHRQQKQGLVGSSIGAFNSVMGLSGTLLVVQNALGSFLDFTTSVRNAFNFSDPYKSSVLLAAVFALWAFLVLVPTKVLLFIGGMAQFGATFYSRFGHVLKSRTKKKREVSESLSDDAQASPVATWITNALRGLPTDEDIRKTYFWESRRVGHREMEVQAEEKRKSRLQRLWKAQWYSPVQIVQSVDSNKKQQQHQQSLKRQTVFAMIQGHRFLWWQSATDFDNGEVPSGRIFLAGHSGLATPSPLEMRAMDQDEVPRVAIVFGRGAAGQARVTILTPDMSVKDRLEHAVTFCATTKND